jgi:hypothetical protein
MALISASRVHSVSTWQNSWRGQGVSAVRELTRFASFEDRSRGKPLEAGAEIRRVETIGGRDRREQGAGSTTSGIGHAALRQCTRGLIHFPRRLRDRETTGYSKSFPRNDCMHLRLGFARPQCYLGVVKHRQQWPPPPLTHCRASAVFRRSPERAVCIPSNERARLPRLTLPKTAAYRQNILTSKA